MQHFKWSTPSEIEKTCSDMEKLRFEQIRIVTESGFKIVKNGTSRYVKLQIDKIIKMVKESGSTEFCLIHNHPKQKFNGFLVGYSYPSELDKIETKELIEKCKKENINLIDHLIITGENDYFGLLKEMDKYEHNGYLHFFEYDLIYSFKNNGLIGG